MLTRSAYELAGENVTEVLNKRVMDKKNIELKKLNSGLIKVREFD